MGHFWMDTNKEGFLGVRKRLSARLANSDFREKETLIDVVAALKLAELSSRRPPMVSMPRLLEPAARVMRT
jgi:hypothetical protein